MTLDEIRSDFKEIRYYYTRKQIFDEALKTVGENNVTAKVLKYNEAARNLPPNLFDIYIGLYIKNFTQENLACELGYTLEHVNRLNKKILLFMQKNLPNKEESKNG